MSDDNNVVCNASKSPTPAVEVTQADRDAAADAVEALNVHAWEKSVEHIRTGNADKSYSVQAFARHRIASTPKLPDDAAVERLREALDTAAWNMQTLATDIRNPGQRALADKWIAAARAALTAPEEKTNVK